MSVVASAAAPTPPVLGSRPHSSGHFESDHPPLPHAGVSQGSQIDAARAEYGHRSDELATALRDGIRARKEQVRAKSELLLAQARVDNAQADVDVAQSGTAGESDEARESLRIATVEADVRREMVRWSERKIARCEQATGLARAEQDLAASRVESDPGCDLPGDRRSPGFMPAEARSSRRQAPVEGGRPLHARTSTCRAALPGSTQHEGCFCR